MIKRIYTIILNRASIIKTVYYNFKYLPFGQAKYMPMIVAKGVIIRGKGKIFLEWDPASSPNIYLGGKALKWMPEPRKIPTIFYIEGELHIKAGFYFGSGGGMEIERGATLTFDRNFNATAKCTIICRNNISFGQDVLVSWDTLIMDSDQHTIFNINSIEDRNYDGSIQIGNHIWISSKVTILKNTIVGSGCVIGSETLVHGNFNRENMLIAGNPARICKEKIRWSQERPLKTSIKTGEHHKDCR